MEFFVVGSPVRIRPWSELVSIFGLDHEGGIVMPDCLFPREWRVYCGRTVWVEDIIEYDSPEGESLMGYEVSGIPGVCFLPLTAVE